ncbi:MAG: HD domain-containing phosphohydrolase [Candidatus Eisenbacteria bacterium]
MTRERRRTATGSAKSSENRMAVDLLDRLHVLMQNAEVGAKDDETTVQTSRSARSILECLLEESDTVRFDVISDCVLFQEGRLNTGSNTEKTFDYFIERMTASGIRAVIFDDSARSVDIRDFAAALTRIDDSCRDPFQEMKRLLKFEKINRIKITERKTELDEFYERNELLLSNREMAHRAFLSALHVVGRAVEYGIAGAEVRAREVKRVVESVVNCVVTDDKSTLALTRMGDYDEHLHHHSVNVCVLSVALANRLGLPKPALGEIGIAALLHDIGKRCVAPMIVNKFEDVTAYDWEQIRRHPEAGVQVLAQIKKPDKAMLGTMVAAFCHHMNIDRTGYPQTDRDIRPNLSSRVIRIADIYDNLTSARSDAMKPYSRGEALAIIGEKAAAELDPTLCAVFADLTDSLPDSPYVPEPLEKVTT